MAVAYGEWQIKPIAVTSARYQPNYDRTRMHAREKRLHRAIA
jgi:hypothetical protein